jgi:Rrf2 family protein
MKISRRAQYAVRAALDLAARASTQRGIRSAEIAGRTRVPDKFLEAVLRDLREAGLVTSKRGPDGGHRLAADPARVTVLAVVEAIDGLFGGSLESTREAASPQERCVNSVWDRVAAAVRETLADVTLEDLRREAVAPGPADYTI